MFVDFEPKLKEFKESEAELAVLQDRARAYAEQRKQGQS